MHSRAVVAMFLACALIASVPSAAKAPPPTMMSNVYRLAEAAAVLHVCAGSAAAKSLSSERAQHLQGLIGRIAAVIRNIAGHYKDDELLTTFEMTKAKIADEPEMQGYVERKYQDCGERLFQDMEAYVAENEKLINGYFTRQSTVNKGAAR